MSSLFGNFKDEHWLNSYEQYNRFLDIGFKLELTLISSPCSLERLCSIHSFAFTVIGKTASYIWISLFLFYLFFLTLIYCYGCFCFPLWNFFLWDQTFSFIWLLTYLLSCSKLYTKICIWERHISYIFLNVFRLFTSRFTVWLSHVNKL